MGVTGALLLQTAQAVSNIVLWDTGTPFIEGVNAEDRDAWRVVPSELFVFEADPAKAASDPGYYGREYEFTGDAVVENTHLAAVFQSAKGRVALYSKPYVASTGHTSKPVPELGIRVLEFVPLSVSFPARQIRRPVVVRNVGDEVVLEVAFGDDGVGGQSFLFSFDKTEIVHIQPAASGGGIRLLSRVQYGVVPAFVGDDLVFGPTEYGSAETLELPAEAMFVGLVEGETSQWVMTWPPGKQRLRVRPARETDGGTVLESVDFDPQGLDFCLAALSAPGIWHREDLTAAFLEKDVALAWKPPFPARWKTQLSEGRVRTTFTFREARGQIWRGVPGSYEYPVWLDGETAFYRLSKKVPPKGESVLYFLEGRDTPPAVSTPVDVLKATLGRHGADSILDTAGRKLRTHHRRGEDTVHRACTCGCTEVIQAIFEAGQEVAERETVKQALEDMNFFVRCHVERIEEYRSFAGEMIRFLRAEGDAVPGRKPFCDRLSEQVQQIPEAYDVQRENMKSLEYARELTQKTLALTARKSPDNLDAYLQLLEDWRAMGGAQDYVLALCHTITRELAQAAGYGCVHDPETTALALEVRARCRRVLRNPDGYEIWADY